MYYLNILGLKASRPNSEFGVEG